MKNWEVNQYWNNIGIGGTCKVMWFSELAPAVSDLWIDDT